MFKSLLRVGAVSAGALLVGPASAEIALNENISVEGYVLGAAVVNEGTEAKNLKIGNSDYSGGGNMYNSAKFAVNGKYNAFSGKLSVLAIHSNDQTPDTIADVGILDAYLTYTVGNLAITGGKFIGSLGTESFDGLNNAFISYSALTFSSPYATGLKAEYTTAAFMAGVAVRDSQFGPDQGVKTGNFFEGDGSFKDDLGYEAYFVYSGIDKFKLGAGFGYQKVNDFAPDEDRTFTTYDVWATYALTEKLTLLAECAAWRKSVDYSWNVQASYAFTADWSGAVRVTGSEGYQDANDVFGYGVASTYNICKNFALKAEVTKTENNAVDTSDIFSYALQAVLKF